MSVLGYSQLFKGASNSGGTPLVQLAFTSKIPPSTPATSVTTDAINTTGANLVVVVVCDSPSTIGAVGTLSDNKSNTALLAVASTSTLNPRVSIYYYDASKSFGTGHTFTWSTGAVVSYPVIYVYAFSGASSSPLKSYNSNFNTGSITSLSTNSVSPAINNSAIITAFSALGSSFGNGTQPSISGGGFTNANQTTWNNSVLNRSVYAGIYKLDQLTAAVSNPTHTFTITNTAGAATAIAAFK